MPGTNETPQDDVISQAAAAMRRIPAREAASPEVLNQTLAGIRAQLRTEREVGRSFTQLWRPTTALVVSGALAAILLFTVFAFMPSHRSLAFEQIVQRLHSATQLSFTAEVSGDGYAMKTRVWIMAPNKERTEMEADGLKTVMIRVGSKGLVYNATKSTAEFFDIPNGPFPYLDLRQALLHLQSTVNKDARSLGEKTIAGIRAKGFEVTKEGGTTIIWASAETGDPIHIELSGGGEKWVFTGFRFDEPMAEPLFSLQAPEGYTVQQAPPLIYNRVAIGLVALLKLYAEQNGGKFPPNLDNEGQNLRADLKLPGDEGPFPPETIRPVGHMMLLARFLKASTANEHFGYFPGASFGDKEKLVFWCIDPPYTIFGSFQPLVPDPDALAPEQLQQDFAKDVKYLGVYGDLRVEALKREQVPGLK